MEFTSTIFGGQKLLNNGYMYVKDKDSIDVIYWRCVERGLCNARITTYKSNGSVKKPPSIHNHPPDNVALETARTIGEIKVRSTLTEEATSSVIQNCTKSISIAAAVKLPSKQNLAKIVRRKRKAPEEDFSESVHTTRGQQFLISNDTDLDLLILGTEENIRMLDRYPNWFCDGTFDSAPLGYQLYTIHALLTESVTIPLIFCIAKNKTETVYTRIFSTLKEHNSNLDPNTIMVDYEKAAINALSTTFPCTEIQGCYFHFGQAIWRHIQALGLQQRYKNEEEFSICMKQFRALAFLPIEDVILIYEEYVNSLCDELIDYLSDFLLYFEKTWVGIEHHGRRRRPLYPIALWNVRDRVERVLPRTNNSVEGWHRATHYPPFVLKAHT